MSELDQIGKTIVLRHNATGELHEGTVDDVKPGGWIVVPGESMKMFWDEVLLDTTYTDKWTFVRIEDE